MEKDMMLPNGKKADSCVHFYKCSRMFGCKKENEHCDFSPSRYYEKELTTHKGYTIQRMNKDSNWYAIKDNRLRFWSRYRNDIKSWIDARVD